MDASSKNPKKTMESDSANNATSNDDVAGFGLSGSPNFERSLTDQLMSCKSDDNDVIDDSLEDTKVLEAEEDAAKALTQKRVAEKKAGEKRGHEGSEAPAAKKSKKNGDEPGGPGLDIFEASSDGEILADRAAIGQAIVAIRSRTFAAGRPVPGREAIQDYANFQIAKFMNPHDYPQDEAQD